ncbi:hypothetical protein [[Kitasatospora] papulosa]|uniref:hypothetical protein n=1 Tax=[Kitasatospora] papulosa TaxID=1464011 RepID=UPI0036E74BAE
MFFEGKAPEPGPAGQVRSPVWGRQTSHGSMGVKLGVFLTNSKTRRARLAADNLAVLAALGLEWAA